MIQLRPRNDKQGIMVTFDSTSFSESNSVFSNDGLGIFLCLNRWSVFVTRNITSVLLPLILF